MRFPRQDIPSIQKNKEWYKEALTYAESIIKAYNPSADRMSNLYATFNGTRKTDGVKWLTKTYGKKNRAPYVEYRLGSTKIKLLHGEWLKRPLSATVQTINSSAMSEKMRQFNFMKGAQVAKQELEEIKGIVGVDVMEGVQIPESDTDPIWDKMSFKDKSEDIMQLILDEQIKSLKLKGLTGQLFQDVLITSMFWCKTELDEKGDVKVYQIDPRDAIYELIDGDYYFERSTVKGARQTMTVEEVLRRFSLTKEERDRLDEIRTNPDSWINKNPKYIRRENGQLVVDVIHIEWKGVNTDYLKTFEPKPNGVTQGDREATIPLDPTKYEKDKVKFETAGSTITEKFREEWYEATRIGGVIDINCRPKPWQPRDMDNPSYVLNCSYHGFTTGFVDGTRVSLQQQIENFDNLFDIIMYKISKELSRAKGKVITFDRAALTEGQTLEEVVFRAVNDQFLDYNSSAAGNIYGKQIDPANMFKEIDLGVSSSFPYLIEMANYIIGMLNQITGINEGREGNIAPSSTATNAQSAIQNSRTITEPIFYGMNEAVQMLLENITNLSAISWAFYKTEKGEQILGSDRFNFLKVSQEEGYKNYGVHIEDGSRYMEMKMEMRRLAEFSLNAKELRPIDVLNLQSAETMVQMKQVLQQSWSAIEQSRMAMQEQQNQTQQQMAEAANRNQYQIHREILEDAQVNEKDNIVLKGDVQMAVDNNKAKGKMVENQIQNQNDILNAPEGMV